MSRSYFSYQSALRKYYHLYWFGMTLGCRNLAKNGFSIGVKKTLGKIFQPVNSYSRFPEYECFFQLILALISKRNRTKILDVGSPKLFGLYLAYYYPVDLIMTDVYECNVGEYKQLWDCIKKTAKGQIEFQVLDGRDMPFDGETFDLSYSMSVIEHVDCAFGDKLVINELNRVLKKDGYQIVSVPYGSRFINQNRHNFSYDYNSQARNSENVFFQKIYTLKCLPDLLPKDTYDDCYVTRIERVRCTYIKLFMGLPEYIRGALGAVSPILATLCTRIQIGESEDQSCEQYGEISADTDIYPDVVIRIPKFCS